MGGGEGVKGVDCETVEGVEDVGEGSGEEVKGG